jgi:flagellar basal-body rod protein FlgG
MADMISTLRLFEANQRSIKYQDEALGKAISELSRCPFDERGGVTPKPGRLHSGGNAMIRALWTAASGMSAQQLNVDTIANNLANVNTTGFKRQRVDYQDLFYQTLREPGTEEGTPNGLEVGMGTYPVATQKIFASGDLERTDTPLDLAIEGTGFFQVGLSDGTIGYTRSGTFRLDQDGRLVTPDGYAVQPEITIPADAQEIVVGTNGLVSVRTSGSPLPTDVGTIELASFSNPRACAVWGTACMPRPRLRGRPSRAPPVWTAWAKFDRACWRGPTCKWSTKWSA